MNYELSNGWTLNIIPPSHDSPMANHRGGEIAVDVEAKTFYGWGVFAACYGLDSMVAACEKYIAR